MWKEIQIDAAKDVYPVNWIASTLVSEWNDWAQSSVVSDHPKHWKAQYLMEVWFLQCNVLLNRSCLSLPFESIANDNNVLQFNWLMEKKSSMLRNQGRKGGVGRGDICSFSMSFGNLMSSENLSNLNWTCPDRIVPSLYLRAALIQMGYYFYLSVRRL